MNTLTLLAYKLERFITARWKAAVPLVAYGISEALKKGPLDWSTPSGIKAALAAVLLAIVVHTVPNGPAK